MKLNRKELLKAPDRKNGDRRYKSILLVPSGLKHDSGYMKIAVVGHYQVEGKDKYEICAWPDDIAWDLSGFVQKYDSCGMRMDCFYPGGVLQMWGRGEFEVEYPSYFSTTIKFSPKKETNV